MKTLVNQAVIQHTNVPFSPEAIVIKPKYTTVQKVILVSKALKEFHQDIAIPYKACAKALVLATFFFASIIAFPLLLVRALDIEAEEREQITIQHHQFIKNTNQFDSPEVKGDR